jgi:hypothetical protein
MLFWSFWCTPWVELTFKNWLVREGCSKAYIHIVKIVLKLCKTLKIVIYYHAPQLTSTAAHSIDTNPMIVISLLTAPLTY